MAAKCLCERLVLEDEEEADELTTTGVTLLFELTFGKTTALGGTFAFAFGGLRV